MVRNRPRVWSEGAVPGDVEGVVVAINGDGYEAVCARDAGEGPEEAAMLDSGGDLPVGVVAEIEDEIAAGGGVDLEVVGGWGGEGLGVGDGGVVGVERRLSSTAVGVVLGAGSLGEGASQ